jgi:hypothetical protein
MSRRFRGRRGNGARWVGVVMLVIVAAFFSFLNASERAALNLGFTTVYRVSLVGLVFGAFLLGMITMFIFGLRYDRRVRDALRERAEMPPPSRNPYPDHPPPITPP